MSSSMRKISAFLWIFKLAEDKDWKRVKPSQARAAVKIRRNKNPSLNEDELKDMLGDEEDSE